MIKNIHSTSEFKAHSIFQRKHKFLKNPECKKYIVNAMKNFRENSVFQGKCKLFKNAERWKNFQCSVFSVYSLGGCPCELG